MSELIMGLLMGVDAWLLYLLLPHIKYKFLLAVWTAFLHFLFPLVGYMLGDLLASYFSSFAQIISSFLLFCIGLQFLLAGGETKKIYIHPLILALSVSLDTFSVSVSFGMLSLHKYLFILSAAIGAFVLSYFSLKLSSKAVKFQTSMVNKIVGIIIMTISVWSYLKL